MSRIISTSEMELADTVCRYSPTGEPDAWMCSIVKQVTDETVTLFRPYGTTQDFALPVGVICLIGIEVFTVGRDSFKGYVLLNRKKLL